MTIPKKSDIIFKTIAAAMACVFLCHQVAWAGDLIDVMMDKMNADQSQTFAPSYLQNQQTLHEDLIGQKQDLEDLQAANLAANQTERTQGGATLELQKRSSSGQSQIQPQAQQQTQLLSPEEKTASAATAATLIEDGALIAYLDQAADLAQREKILAQNIAIAQEGLKIVDQSLEDAKARVSAKEAEIAGIANTVAALEAEQARISQALEDLAEEKVGHQNESSNSKDYLDRVQGEKAALQESLNELKIDMDAKKEIAERAAQELEFAMLDYDNTISIIRQALGNDFDIYDSTYNRTYSDDGKVASVALADARTELDALAVAAKEQVDDSVDVALSELGQKVADARNSIYEDELSSLAQLDALCVQREEDIIAKRDQGLIDIEAERVRVTDEANAQFGPLYDNISAQRIYWAYRKAALYQSGNIEAYIYAATMATLYVNQLTSISTQWDAQIASINQQCDDAITQLQNDAAAAIANIPLEKEAAILEIENQRDALLKQVDDARLEQEAAIYAERDKAFTDIDRQTADALSVICAKESLVLSAWQISYLEEDLAIESSQKEADFSIAQDLYDENAASFDSFIGEILNPAQDAYYAAQAAYEKTSSDIASNENDLSANNTTIITLNDKIALLSAELSKLNDDLAGKAAYYDRIQSLLNDMLDAEKLLLLQKYRIESLYSLLLSRQEELKDVADSDASVGDTLQIGANSPELFLANGANETIYQPGNSVSAPLGQWGPEAAGGTTLSNVDISSLVAMLPEPLPPLPQTLTDAGEEIRVDAEIDYNENGLLLRSEEMPMIDPAKDLAASADGKSLQEAFKALFGREPSEGALEIFGKIMLLPCLPDNRITSVTIDDKEYIFNDSGDIEMVLDGDSEVLKYLYNSNGDLEAIDFTDAKRVLEDTKNSVGGSVADKLDRYEAALDEQKALLEGQVAEKFAEYSGAIETRAQTLRDQVLEEYSDRKTLLDTEKTRLEALEGYLEKKTALFGELQMDERVYDDDNTRNDIEKVRSQINDIDDAIQKNDEDKEAALQTIETERRKAADNLDSEKAVALRHLDAKIEGVKNSLVGTEDSIMSDLSRDAGEALSVINTQEDYALIRYYFKEGLGREPTYDEMVYCQENGYTTKESLLGEALKDEITARQAFKDSVIQNIRSALEDGRFGSLSQDAKDAIITYFNKQSLHFGASALMSLFNELKAQGLDADEASLLTELILQEIEDGNLEYTNGAPLQLSMNALIEVAKGHGLELAGYNVTLDELAAAMRASGKAAIVLINENHYVTILSVDEETVTYLDPSVGKNGASVTIAKEEFEKKFSGNVMAQVDTIDKFHLLAKDKLIDAKGAGFWSSICKFFGAIGDFFCDLFETIARVVTSVVNAVWNGIQAAVNAIANVVISIVMIPVNFVNNIAEGNWGDALWTLGSLIPGVGAIHSAIEGDWVGAGVQVGMLLLNAGLPGISAAASGIGRTIGEFASGIIAPITNAIAPLVNGVSSIVGGITSAISDMAGPLCSAIGNIASSIGTVFKPITDIASNIVSSISSSPIGQFVIQPIIAAGILEGSKVTLTELGLNDTIANIGAAAISGYAAAGMSDNGNLAVPITLGAVASASFKEIGAKLDLDETITGALSKIAGEFTALLAINAGTADLPEDQAYTVYGEEEVSGLADLSNFEFGDTWPGGSTTTSSIADSPTYAIYSAVDAVVTAENLKDAAVGAITNNPMQAYTTTSAILGYLNLLINAQKDSGRPNDSPGGSTSNSSGGSSDIVNNFLLMNGINNKELFTVPKYIETFASHLETISPGDDNITKVSLYNDIPIGNPQAILGIDALGMTSDTGRDIAGWLVNTDKIAADIYNKVMAENGDEWPDQSTAMCYSGSGDPFLNLLNQKPELDVKSVVLVGTPLRGDRWIENSNLETVVTIYGENDGIFFWNEILRKDFYAETCKLFANNTKQVNEVVIKLKGIGHTDYFYDPSDPGFNADKEQKASRFIAEVTYRSKDPEKLRAFLNRAGTTDTNGKYIIDVNKATYD